MSEPNEDKLVESLVWSNQEFSLAEFVETYELPQVVRVEIGFFGDNERTTLSSGQLLTLHSLRKTSRVLCDVPHDSAVLIPLNCPLKVEVHPKECKYSTVTPDQLSTLYRHIKYVRVLPEQYDKKCRPRSFGVDDVLQIIHVDHDQCLIKCKNVATNRKVSIPFDCVALFAPLIDHREYTLAEVKYTFGFPAKVRFLDKKTERKLRSKNKDSSRLVTSLGEVTVMEEIEETVVISTTVSGKQIYKACLHIPKELDIQVSVAEGFMSGDQTYQRIVRTLDKALNRTSLKNFEDLDLYQHINAFTKSILDQAMDSSVENASEEIKQRARELRSLEFRHDKPPAILPPKGQTSVPSGPPPRPGPKPIVQQKPKTKVSKALSMPMKSPAWLHSLFQNPRKTDKISSTGDQSRPSSLRRSTSDNDSTEYVEPLSPKEYGDLDNKNYTPLNLGYVSSDQHHYQKLHWENTARPPKPSIPPPEVPRSPVSAMKKTIPREEVYDEPYKERPPKPSIPQPEVPRSPVSAMKKPIPREEVYDEPYKERPPKPSIPPPEVLRSPVSGMKNPIAREEVYDEPYQERPPEPGISIVQLEVPKSTLSEKEEIYQTIARIPQDLSGLSIKDVGCLLVNLNMAAYVQLFEDELVDGEMLAGMDQESLESLNVSSYHIKKLLKFINGWRPNVISVLK